MKPMRDPGRTRVVSIIIPFMRVFMRFQFAGFLVACIVVPTTAASQTAAVHDAYLDEASRMMVAGARAGGDPANSEIYAYEMTAKQRISVGLEAQRRDRLLFRREVASRVSWTRSDGTRTEVLGARAAIPMIDTGVRPIDDNDFSNGVADLAVEPGGGWLLRVPTVGDDDGDEGIIHPLVEGSEEHYRFRSGETTSIRLADGRTIQLVELQVLPRRARSNLLSGSFWLDAATNAPVRGVFSLAAPARFPLGIGSGIISLPLAEASMMLEYLTIEYGLWESRWWLPRIVAFEGTGAVGGVSVPIVLEQAYSDYTIYTTASPWPGFPPPDTTLFRVVARSCGRDDDGCPDELILVPRDTSLLIRSPELPASIFERGTILVGEGDLRAATDLLSISRGRGMLSRIPRFGWNLFDARLFHFNRVEGATIGPSARVDLEPYSASINTWIGVPTWVPSAEVEISRNRLRGAERLTGYGRIEAFSPTDRPFSLGSSVAAFFFGRDDGDYYRAAGIALTSEHRTSSSTSLMLRAYGERQASMEKGTDVSFPHWLRDRVFRDNPAADEADQVGGDVRLQYNHGLDPSGFRVGFDARTRAETGDYRFAQPSLAVYSTFPIPASVIGALEVSVGSTFGDQPVQRLFYVGGRGSVRGIEAAERVTGDTFWAGRAEIGTSLPGARGVVFGDAGWAGSRDDIELDPSLISAGLGVSFLDGLIRADLAKALRGGSGWSLQLHLDAPL